MKSHPAIQPRFLRRPAIYPPTDPEEAAPRFFVVTWVLPLESLASSPSISPTSLLAAATPAIMRPSMLVSDSCISERRLAIVELLPLLLWLFPDFNSLRTLGLGECFEFICRVVTAIHTFAVNHLRWNILIRRIMWLSASIFMARLSSTFT